MAASVAATSESAIGSAVVCTIAGATIWVIVTIIAAIFTVESARWHRRMHFLEGLSLSPRTVIGIVCW